MRYKPSARRYPVGDPPIPPPPPPTDSYDDFNRANGPVGNLDSGETWIYNGGAPNPWVVASNEAKPANDAITTHINRSCVFDRSDANARVGITLRNVASIINGVGIALRYNIAAKSYIFVVTTGSATSIYTFDGTPSGYSLLATNATAFGTGDRLEASIDSANLVTVYKNGVSVLTFTTSYNAADTHHGMVGDDGGGGITIDTFLCEAWP